jgi:hypothetical protein
MNNTSLIALVTAAGLGLAACGGSGETAPDTAADPTAPSETPAAAPVEEAAAEPTAAPEALTCVLDLPQGGCLALEPASVGATVIHQDAEGARIGVLGEANLEDPDDLQLVRVGPASHVIVYPRSYPDPEMRDPVGVYAVYAPLSGSYGLAGDFEASFVSGDVETGLLLVQTEGYETVTEAYFLADAEAQLAYRLTSLDEDRTDHWSDPENRVESPTECSVEEGPAFARLNRAAEAVLAPCRGDVGVEGVEMDSPFCEAGFAENCFQWVGVDRDLRYRSTEESYEFVLVNAASEQLLQSFSEPRGTAYDGPSLVDIDNDGDVELLVPTETGNVNTTYRVHQQTEDGFAFAGEVSGLGLEYDSENGFSAISGRINAAAYYYEAYRLEADGLVLVYALETNYMDENCLLSEGPGFAQSGLDAAAIIAACEAGMSEE